MAKPSRDRRFICDPHLNIYFTWLRPWTLLIAEALPLSSLVSFQHGTWASGAPGPSLSEYIHVEDHLRFVNLRLSSSHVPADRLLDGRSVTRQSQRQVLPIGFLGTGW
jgi:hypothetical protein